MSLSHAHSPDTHAVKRGKSRWKAGDRLRDGSRIEGEQERDRQGERERAKGKEEGEGEGKESERERG